MHSRYCFVVFQRSPVRYHFKKYFLFYLNFKGFKFESLVKRIKAFIIT